MEGQVKVIEFQLKMVHAIGLLQEILYGDVFWVSSSVNPLYVPLKLFKPCHDYNHSSYSHTSQSAVATKWSSVISQWFAGLYPLFL